MRSICENGDAISHSKDEECPCTRQGLQALINRHCLHPAIEQHKIRWATDITRFWDVMSATPASKGGRVDQIPHNPLINTPLYYFFSRVVSRELAPPVHPRPCRRRSRGRLCPVALPYPSQAGVEVAGCHQMLSLDQPAPHPPGIVRPPLYPVLYPAAPKRGVPRRFQG